MATRMHLLAPDGEGRLVTVTVSEAADAVRDQWGSAPGQAGLLQLTRRHDEAPIQLRMNAIAYWVPVED